MSSDTDQARVLAFLADPRTHGGEAVRRIDTHAAAVFLAGSRVLKIKRAVKFPFLDFTTLAKREAACRAELEINRSFAPELYRGVVAITQDDGGLTIGGVGPVVEWAVEMRRFDESRTLDNLADAGSLDAQLADKLARAVAAAHVAAPPADPAMWLREIVVITDQNERELRASGDLASATEIDRLAQATRAAIVRLRPLLAARGSLGLVRRCHGDLHLGNIALIEDRPVLFDALEFDPLMASGDVFYDLAFLLMDLVDRGLDGPANVVLNRYLAETRRVEDLDALATLPLFISMRAAIRAKVTAARVRGDDPQAAELRRKARVYFDLALRAIAPPAPSLVAVGGLSGTGKSVLARALAPELPPIPGAVVLRSDVERKTLRGVEETEHLGEDAYTPEAAARVYGQLNQKARRIVEAGHSVIVDAVFAREDERKELAAVAGQAKVALHGLFLWAELDTRIKRLSGRTNDASDATADTAALQERYDLGTLAWSTVDASGTPAETLRRARDRLAPPRKAP